jgi:2-amino-4-hydroxy-6-hydroxymethyldihydropteridine diphosphokinase
VVDVFIALGSNLGDRVCNLEDAVVGLRDFVDLTRTSPIYETEPKYLEDQPRFLNMVVAGKTALTALDLLQRMKALESSLGRVPSERYGPRLIDLDIIFFGDDRVDSPELTVPHPKLAERAFVLRPLADIAPDTRHPISGDSVLEMLNALPGDDGIERLRSDR